MGNYVASDNAATTLAASITNSPTVNSITVADASKFPVLNHGGVGSDWSYVTLFDASNNMETVKVTRRDNASNTLSIVRGTAAGISGVTDANCRSWTSTTTGVAIRLISQIVTDLRVASVNAAADAASAAASAAAAVAGVKVTNNDTTAGKLNEKVAVAGGITKSVLNSGGNEQLQFSVTFPVTTVFGRAGAVTLQAADVTGALGYTPFNFGANTPVHSGNVASQSVNYANTAGRARPTRNDGANWDLTWANPGGNPTYYLGSSDGVDVRPYAVSSLGSIYAPLSGATFSGSIFLNATGGEKQYGFNLSGRSVYFYGSGTTVGLYDTVNGGRWSTDTAGNFTANGNVIAYSDERLKANWRPLSPDFIERLARVRMGIYDRTDRGITQVGVGAQSLQQLLPEAVVEDGDGTLGVAYGNAALAACVALAAEVVVLRAEIEKLKAVR